MPVKQRLLSCLPIAAALAMVAHGLAYAEDVTLMLRSGGFSVIGELMASDTSSFVIKSPKYGVMALETAKFDCTGVNCPKRAATTVAIHGSNTIGAQLMPTTIERFAEQEGYTVEKVVGADPEEVQFKLSASDGKDVATIELQSHGSNTAPPALTQAKAQIGTMSRPIKPEEVKAIGDAGFKLNTSVFALDGVIVFVSPQNPVKSLSLDQIAKIYSGDTKDWSEVGGTPGKITLYARDKKSGTYDTFDNLVLKPRNLKISPEAKRFESSPDLSDTTARDPNGIGFAGFAYLRSAKALAISSPCGIVSPPEVFSVKTEEYPLSRRLYLQTTNSLSPLATKLLDFSLSDKAQDPITEVGFVNQRIDLQTFEAQTPRLAPALLVPDKEFNFPHMRDLINDLKGAKRLSLNFRFQRNATQFDNKALQDIPRLARFLTHKTNKAKEILLVGFTDNGGPFDANRLTAFKQAMQFKSALVAEGVPVGMISARGYGNLLPVGCNSTDAGREANRRVEVWVKE